MRPWMIFLIAAAVLLVYGGRNVVRDFVTRGKRLTVSTTTDGAVRERPELLVAEAARTLGRDVDPEAYALARMIRSEAGSRGVREKAAIGFVALNDARSHSWSVLETVTKHRRRTFTFGEQSGGGRYSTARDPYENDLALAEAILAAEVEDETRGATKFVHERSMGGVQAGSGSFADLVVRWGREGYEPFRIPDTTDLVLFRRTA